MRRITLALAAFVLLLAGHPAFAANRVWIAECSVLGEPTRGGPAQVCAIPFLADSGPLDVTTIKSVVVTNQTRIVRICADSQTSFRGASGATTSNSPIFAGTCEYFGVEPNSTVSVIASP